MNNTSYVKHLISCRCVLPQFKYKNPPLLHSFVVFSILEEDELQPSFICCNNCGVVHKVTEINQSKILGGKEEIKTFLTEKEIKSGIPDIIIEAVSSYNLDLSTWQEIRFIIDKELWGKMVVLEKESLDENTTSGKILVILGKELYKISNFSREEFIL